MNIFALSSSARQSALYHGDKHVVKMILESCQMLYTAHWSTGSSLESAPLAKNGQRGYKPTHKNHPCTKWVREGRENYVWTACLALALADEYEFRWGRIHGCKEHAVWLSEHIPALPLGSTPFAVAMDDQYKIPGNPIESYRNYYIQSKSIKGLAVYTRRSIPEFLVCAGRKSEEII